MRRPPRSPLFPYPTLFRSIARRLSLELAFLPPGPLGYSRIADFTLDQVFRDALFQPVRTDIEDRKSTRLNSSHANISYAVFCLKKKFRSEEHTSELQSLHY